MTVADDLKAAMMRAASEIEAENDNFLRAVAMLSANGRAQIIPTDNGILWPSRAVICLPRKQYDRLREIITKEAVNA